MLLAKGCSRACIGKQTSLCTAPFSPFTHVPPPHFPHVCPLFSPVTPCPPPVSPCFPLSPPCPSPVDAWY